MIRVRAICALCACVIAVNGVRAADKAPVTPTPDSVAEQIFKQADKLHTGKLTEKEYTVAVQLVQQYAMTLPLPTPIGGKKGSPAPANLGAAAATNPDLNNDKKISLDEFKSVFPSLVSTAQAQLATQKAAMTRNPKMKP